jgi:hypothetical protein
MENHRDGRARARTGIETAFETAFGTRKNNFGHRDLLESVARPNGRAGDVAPI